MNQAPEVFVFLADDSSLPPLDEGIVGFVHGPIKGQLVTINTSTLQMMNRLAQEIATVSGRAVRCVRFTRAEVVGEFVP